MTLISTLLQKSVKCLIFLLLVLAMSCSQDTNDPCDSQDTETSIPVAYSFFVAGHVYGKPLVDNAAFHPPFKEKFGLIQEDAKIEFGVLTGDIVDRSIESNWDEVDIDVATLGKQVYFAVGNHDVGDRSLYESRYGDTYYSYLQNGDLFIVLDSNLEGWNIAGDQLLFLQQQLTTHAANVENIFVFFHHLLWWEPDNRYQNITLNSLENRANEINFWTEIEPLFNNLDNEVFMFAGDLGATQTASAYMYHNYDNITLIGSGMGKGTHDNFVIVDVREDKTVTFRLIALNGPNINALCRLVDYDLP